MIYISNFFQIDFLQAQFFCPSIASTTRIRAIIYHFVATLYIVDILASFFLNTQKKTHALIKKA